MNRNSMVTGLILVSLFYINAANGQNWMDLLDAADSLYRARNYDSAIVIGKLALKAAESEPEPNDTLAANVLNHLGVYYFSQTDYGEAESYWRSSLALWESALGPEHLRLTSCLQNLGNLYRHQARYAESEEALQRSLTIREKTLGPEHLDVATSLSNLGVHYSDRGEYDQAESLFRRSLAIREKALGPDHLDVAHDLHQLAHIRFYQADYVEAELLYEKALDIREKELPPGHPDLARSLNCLANLHYTWGRFPQARSFYERSLAIREAALGPDHPSVAIALINLANVIYAEFLMTREPGDLPEAASLCERALAIREKVFGPDHPKVGNSAMTLGNIRSAQGDYVRAHELYSRSLAIEEKTLGPNHPDVAASLGNLANACGKLGRYAEAESLYQRSLEISEERVGPNHPSVALVLECLSRNSRHQAHHSEAVGFAARAYGIRREHFSNNVQVLSEKDARSYSNHARRTANNYFVCYTDLPERADSVIEGGVDIALSCKGQVSDEMLWRQKALVKESDSATLALAESLKSVKFSLSDLFIQGPGEDANAYHTAVDSLSLLIADLETDLSRASASFRQRRDQEIIDAVRVRSLLPTSSALIEYMKYTYFELPSLEAIPRYIAAILTDDRKPDIIMLGNASTIDSLTERYRKHMLRLSSYGKPLPEDQDEYRRISRELYDRLWKPVVEYVSDRDLVLIAPDGALNLISFAGLMDSDSSYLAEKSTIHYLTCGRDLVRLKDKGMIARGLFAFGDPDYDAAALARLKHSYRPEDSLGSATYYATRNVRSSCLEFAQTRLSPLPATRSEVEQLLAHWQQATDERAVAYFDSDASEERFKLEAPGHRVIHLATHGYFLTGRCQAPGPDEVFEPASAYADENPLLLSGLFVAGANLHGAGADSIGCEDGVLTAYEVSAMNLEGTDLVVLSACETALGEIDEGEGVYGLRRAFQMAGARTVISALWPISDQATSEILSRLYEQKGQTMPEQLRALQLEQIQALREAGELDHPVNWAAFIAIGGWE